MQNNCKDPDLLSNMDQIRALCPQEVVDDLNSRGGGSRKFGSNRGNDDEDGLGEVTYKALCLLHKKLKTAKTDLRRSQAYWVPPTDVAVSPRDTSVLPRMSCAPTPGTWQMPSMPRTLAQVTTPLRTLHHSGRRNGALKAGHSLRCHRVVSEAAGYQHSGAIPRQGGVLLEGERPADVSDMEILSRCCMYACSAGRGCPFCAFFRCCAVFCLWGSSGTKR